MNKPLRYFTVGMFSASLGASTFAQMMPTPVTQVPGKEYSDHRDVDSLQVPDPLQNLAWDGVGNNADAFDYSGSVPTNLSVSDEVDALGNYNDAYFQAVISNQAALVLSLEGENWIRYHDINGTVGTWATANQVRMPTNAMDVDAIEIWGPIDADHYSQMNDGSSGTSVFYYDGTNSISLISQSMIAGAVNNFLKTDFPDDLFDVDALMVQNGGTLEEFEPGDEILFSLRPIQDPTGGLGGLDGGEIFHLKMGAVGAAPSVAFLNQGGVLWDTANDVMGLFGSNSENIDGIEAVPMVIVPEPSLLLPVLAFFVAFGCLRRNRS